MNIQLFLENVEVELDKPISIPLNKTYENLSNPSDIIVEYSKSINIPMTVKNNNLMGHLYNVSRTIVDGGTRNIGLYLDPNKRIPFKLIFNGKLIMEGYAKFLSVSYSEKNKYYTLNLYGALGDVLHKLKEVVVDSSKLSEGQGEEYVLNDHCDGDVIDKNYVWSSFQDDDPESDINECHDWEIIGMAPSYRGYYSNFKSDMIERNGSAISLSSIIADQWKERRAMDTLGKHYNACTEAEKQTIDTYVDALGPSEAIGDGMKEYQMKEYRGRHQRPYIYFNKLMQMYQEKCEELTGYTLDLDRSWFNPSNPYWNNMCYMLNFLDANGLNSVSSTVIGRSATRQFAYIKDVATNPTYVTDSKWKGTTQTLERIIPVLPGATGRIDFNNISLKVKHTGSTVDSRYANAIRQGRSTAKFMYTTQAVYLIDVVLRHPGEALDWNSSSSKHFWFAPDPYHTQGANVGQSWTLGTENNCSFTYSTDYSTSGDTITVNLNGDVTIPSFNIVGNWESGGFLDMRITLCTTTGTYYAIVWASKYQTYLTELNAPIYLQNNEANRIEYGTLEILTVEANNVRAKLKNVYNSDEPLFNVILQYTKMFNLMWDIDYEAKTVKILPIGKYFEGYTVENWDDKLDRSKDYVIEPVVFPSKYIKFNYDGPKGYRYSNYKTKYNAEIGEKKVKTNYDFNTEDTKLFEGINACVSSNRQIIYFNQLLNWDLTTTISGETDLFERLECASEDDKSSIGDCCWALRGENYDLDEPGISNDPIIITDDSPNMIMNNEYCWLDVDHIPSGENLVVECHYMPRFSMVFTESSWHYSGNNWGGLFNQPMEDYTKNKVYSAASGRFIYDLIWKEYIDERYNIQNKKLTAYFYLTDNDYFNFKFNQFVTIQDQLFCVNKIYDYAIGEHKPTKVDLIQITNPSVYTTVGKIYSAIYVTPEYVQMGDSATGSIVIYARAFPDPQATLVIDNNPDNCEMNIDDVEILDHDWKLWVIAFYTDDVNNWRQFKAHLHITSGDDEVDVPIYGVRPEVYNYTVVATPDTSNIDLSAEFIN